MEQDYRSHEAAPLCTGHTLKTVPPDVRGCLHFQWPWYGRHCGGEAAEKRGRWQQSRDGGRDDNSVLSTY